MKDDNRTMTMTIKIPNELWSLEPFDGTADELAAMPTFKQLGRRVRFLIKTAQLVGYGELRLTAGGDE